MYIRFEVEGTGLWWAGRGVLWASNETWRPTGTRPKHVRPARHSTIDQYDELLGHLVTGLTTPCGDAYTSVAGTRTRTFFRMGELTRANIEVGWRLVTILRAHGHRAYEVFSHTPPGVVTFIDERQIVVRQRLRR